MAIVALEAERALAKIGIPRLDILRPGLLRGHRENDRRPGERFGIAAAPLFNLLLHGKSRKYRAIRAADVSRAIFALSGEKARGRFVHDNDQMLYAIRRAGD